MSGFYAQKRIKLFNINRDFPLLPGRKRFGLDRWSSTWTSPPVRQGTGRGSRCGRSGNRSPRPRSSRTAYPRSWTRPLSSYWWVKGTMSRKFLTDWSMWLIVQAKNRFRKVGVNWIISYFCLLNYRYSEACMTGHQYDSIRYSFTSFKNYDIYKRSWTARIINQIINNCLGKKPTAYTKT